MAPKGKGHDIARVPVRRESDQRPTPQVNATPATSSEDVEPSVPEESPPGYSGPSATFSTPRRQGLLAPGLPNLAYAKYRVPKSTLSQDRTTRTVLDNDLIASPVNLEKFLYDQAALPPIRITGVHTERGLRRVDFDLNLSLLRYITRPNGDHWNYVQSVGPDEQAYRGGKALSLQPAVRGGLREWVQMFCKDGGIGKSFQLTREVVNLDKQFLDGQIRSLFAAINYRGHLSVAFPVSHTHVVIQPESRGNNFLNTLMSPFVERKRFETVTAVWPFASLDPAARQDGGVATEFAVQSESAWLSSWRPIIVSAALAGRQGWVALEDFIELSFGATDEPKTIKIWGIDC